VNRTREALSLMAEHEPELAARLVLQTLPAAAAQIPGELTYDLEVDGLGAWRVHVAGGAAQVTPAGNGAATDGAGNGAVDFRLKTDPRTLAEMAAGASPAKLLLTGRLRVRGKRRRVLKLRAMAGGDPSIAEVVRAGGQVDPDLLYRALAYLIDPEWTRGHSFEICYELTGEGGGRWYLAVRDGLPLSVSREPHGSADATVRTDMGTYRALLSGNMAPDQALQRQLTEIEGEIYPVTIFGRWIERSQGRDDDELRREEAQRAVHARRAGTWGATNGAGPAAAPGQGDPAHESESKRRQGGALLSYGELYALWERQNWRAHELDFSVDREHFLATPSEAQQNLIWSLGSFYIGEERVTADLAPFLLAAPTGEIEAFLSTQLVDEARHAVFFDRFGAEVMALNAEDFRGRMHELEQTMLGPWHDVFDDGLREIANRIKERPDDLDLFVEGIATYHVVIEGVLAMTGQRFIIKYMEDHGLYPGFREGFSLVERDEHRHIAFGVRFLKEMVDADRARFGPIVERRVAELVPKAVHVFVPPYAESAERFVSYGYRSEHLYGYAYRALKRRMGVIGLEIPSAEELMPGPIAEPDVARAAGAPA
jgi:ribonucleoside-diphosphate reductase beta chain